MYRSFTIRNFRCFDDLTLSDLARVNLIAGKNNVGKTALLEGIFLHCGAYNPELGLRINMLRGIEKHLIEIPTVAEAPWQSLFHRFDSTQPIIFEGTDGSLAKRILRITSAPETASVEIASQEPPRSIRDTISAPSFGLALRFESEEDGRKIQRKVVFTGVEVRIEPSPPPPFLAFLQAASTKTSFKEQASLFSNLQKHNKQMPVVSALQILEPRLRGLVIGIIGDDPVVHGDIGIGRLMPLPLMGEGMIRVTNMVIQIGNAPNGVVLIDEFENGIHHSVLRKVWTAVAQAAREFNTQIFATTHSWECIVAAHEAFSESDEYDFRLHRLERVNEHIRVVTYDQKTLQAAIETGLEVR